MRLGSSLNVQRVDRLAVFGVAKSYLEILFNSLLAARVCLTVAVEYESPIRTFGPETGYGDLFLLFDHAGLAIR